MRRTLSIIATSLAFLSNPLFGLTASISPSVLDLSSATGEVVESFFTILNTTTNDQMYFVDVMAFEPSGEDGTPVFVTDDVEAPPFLSWIQFSVREVFVPARSKVDVPFQVIIPDDVAAGSYYGAISISTTPSQIVASNGATIEARIAMLVFLTVEGETVETLELLDFWADQYDSSVPFGSFHYRVQNQGNVYLIPMGTITLKGIFGQTIVSLHANESEGRVLPSSTRTYDVLLDSEHVNWLQAAAYQFRHLAMGPVTVDLDLAYGQEGVLEEQLDLFLIPWQLMSLVAFILLMIVWLYKKLRSISR